jgi:hypothetical protein
MRRMTARASSRSNPCRGGTRYAIILPFRVVTISSPGSTRSRKLVELIFGLEGSGSPHLDLALRD